MTVRLVSNQKIAETSSKGNQEKWPDNGKWYKLDQFGYEALAETFLPCFWNIAISKRRHRFASSDTIWKDCWFMAGNARAAAVRIF